MRGDLHAGINKREIGILLGVDYSIVSQGRKRLRCKAEKDENVQSVVDCIEAILSRINGLLPKAILEHISIRQCVAN